MRHLVHLDPGRPAAEILQRPLQAPLAPRPRQATPPRPQDRDPRRRASARLDDYVAAPPATGTQDSLAAEPACPHCRKPVALVAWLVPPAAATVKEPPRHADTVRDNP